MLASSCADVFPRGDGGNKPVAEESSKETVKTIAQETPRVPVYL
jgi:hypothetical protein